MLVLRAFFILFICLFKHTISEAFAKQHRYQLKEKQAQTTWGRIEIAPIELGLWGGLFIDHDTPHHFPLDTPFLIWSLNQPTNHT